MQTGQLLLNFTLLCFLLFTQSPKAQQGRNLKMWYNEPAKQWVEALPVGNGRLGAMIYGDPMNEVIQLNENTLWAGQPNRNDNPDAKAALPEVRKLIFEGKYKEAQDLVNKSIISKTSNGMPYQTVGNLKLTFPEHQNFSNYYRELNLEKAVISSRYELNGVKYQTSVFSSFPDQVIVAQIKADKPGSISFSATMDRPKPSEVTVTSNASGELIMFWFLDKQTNVPEIFGSISAICENTRLKPDNLYYHFSRMKRNEFENENLRIVKCKVKRISSKLQA